MDRRGFLRLLATGLVGSQVDVDRLLWIPGEKKIFLPTPSHISLYGIPYHCSNASMGSWLGISRTVGISKELTEFIQLMESNKK